MADKLENSSLSEILAAKTRRLEAMHLQDIESNPLDAEQIAMFAMFEHEEWSFDKRRDYLLARARAHAAPQAAE